MLKIKEAANYLGVSKDTLRRWEKSGKVKSIRTPSGYRLYYPHHLDQIKSGFHVPEVEEISSSPLKKTVDSSVISYRQQSVGKAGDVDREISGINYSKVVTSEDTSEKPKWQDLPEGQIDYGQPIWRKTSTLVGSLVIILVLTSGLATSLLIHFKLSKLNKGNQIISTESVPSLEEPVLAASNPTPLFLEINTDTTINGNLKVKDASISGTLSAPSILGNTTIEKDLSIGGNLVATGSTTLGTTTTGVATINGLLTASAGITGTAGALNFTNLGASTISTGTNNLTFTSANFTTTSTGINSTAIGSTTASSGSFTTLKASGDTTLSGALSVSGASTLSGATSVGSTLKVSSDTTLSGALSVSGVSTLSGAVTDSSSLAVSGATTLSSTLATSGAATFSSTVAVTGATTLSSTLSLAGAETNSTNGAASTPALKLSGTWFSGGSSTTTKPQLLVEPSSATSTSWSTNGTGVGVNSSSSFTGNLLDLQVNGSSKLSVDYQGNLSCGGCSASGFWSRSGTILSPTTSGDSVSITGSYTGAPSSDAVALTLTGTNVASSNLAYLNAKNTSGTILNISYGSTATLTGSLTGESIDLNNGQVTATNQNVTVFNTKLPTVTNTNSSGTETLRGVLVNFGAGSGINQNGAGATVYNGADIQLPALTQSSGTLTANGVLITTPSSITTGGTANGINLTTTGVGAGTLNAINVGSITAGAGTQTALNIGSGWNSVLTVNSTTIINGSGVTQVAGGGTSFSSYSTGDVLYASSASALTKLNIGSSGQVLKVSSGVPAWGTITGSACTDCLISDPSSTAANTIAPTGASTTGLTVEQTSTASPTADIFDVTNSTGTTKYFYVDKNGNTNLGSSAQTTITLTPTSDTTALTLVGTNVSTAKLAYFNSKNLQGTIFDISYGAAATLNSNQTLTGQSINLSSNVTANSSGTSPISVSGETITLPGPTNTNTSGTNALKGLVVSAGSGINQNGAGGTTTFSGADITIPALTQTAGTLTGNGILITTPSSITTGGTANGINISASGVGAGTLNGINISSITAGAGTQTGIAVGSGWNYAATFQGNVGIGTTSPGTPLDVKSTNTSGTLVQMGAPSAVTLTAALTGEKIDLNTNYTTANGVNVTGQNILMPALTQTNTGTSTYIGYNLGTAGALVQNTAAGTINWTGASIQMPNITQTTGTVTSTGIKVTGGTVTSGTSYGLIVDSNAGNVGIGTTSPSSLFSVGTGSTTNFGINSSGLVGIGTTPGSTIGVNMNLSLSGGSTQYGIVSQPTFNSSATTTVAGIEINASGGSGTYTTPDFAGIIIGANSKGTSQTITNSYGLVVNAESATVTNSYGAYISQISGGSTLNAGLRVTGTTAASTNYAIYADAAAQNYFAGNVGVGTTSPNQLLEVKGTAARMRLTDTNAGTISWDMKLSGGTPSDYVEFQPSNSGGIGFEVADSTGTAQIILAVDGSSSIFNKGNVAINLSSATYRLDLADASANGRGINIAQTATSGAVYGLYSAATGAATTNIGGYFTASGATNNYGLIVNAGNVGIGTTSPGTPLDVKSTNTSGTLVQMGAPSAVTLTAALTGEKIDLNTNYTTANGVNVTGLSLLLPALTQTNTGTSTYIGYNLGTAGALIQNTAAGTINWTGTSITMPNITQTTGTITSSGVLVTGGNITTGGTENGMLIDVSGSTITTGGTLNGLKILPPTTAQSAGTTNSIFLGTSTAATANTLDSATVSVGNITSTAQQNRTTLNLQNGGSGFFDLELISGFVNPQGTNVFYDDFTGISLNTANWQTPTATGTGAVCSSTFVTGVVNGVLRFTTGTGNPSSCQISTQATISNGFYQRGNNPIFETKVKMGSATSTSQRAFFGFTNSAVSAGSDTLTAAHAYIGKRKADTNWQCITSDGTTESVTDTGVAISTSAFQRLRVTVQNGTTPQVVCSVDSTSVSKTSNVPGQTTAMDIYMKAEDSDGTSENDDIDYVRAWQDDPITNIAQTNSTNTSTPATISSASTTLPYDAVTRADLAENYAASSSATLQPGELLSLGADDTMVPSTGAYDAKLFGIVSTSANLILGSDNQANNVRVALSGRVPTIVSGENGPIQVGDYLTSSSTPGVAMKANKPGLVVGRALENYLGAGVGKILVFVNVSFADPGNVLANLTLDSDGSLIIPKVKTSQLVIDSRLLANSQEASGSGSLDSSVLLSSNREASPIDVASTLQSVGSRVATQSAQLATLSQQVASQSAQTNDLAAQIASQSAELARTKSDVDLLKLTPAQMLYASSSATLAKVNVTDSLSSLHLTTLEATISGTLKSLGNSFLGNTTVAGDFSQDGTLSITAGNTINALPTLFFQNSSLANLVDFFSGKVTIDKEGRVALEKLALSGKTLGSTTIPSGHTSIEVSTNQLTEKSKVFTTSSSPAPVGVNKNPSSGKFTLNLEHPLSQDTNIDWWIVDSR